MILCFLHSKDTNFLKNAYFCVILTNKLSNDETKNASHVGAFGSAGLDTDDGLGSI
jgi:hypothetical protein